MKKIIIAIVCIVLVVALAVGGFFFVRHNKSDSTNTTQEQTAEIIDEYHNIVQKDEYSKLMRVSSIDELKSTASSLKLALKETNNEYEHKYEIKNVNIQGIDINFEYQLDSKNNMLGIYASYVPFKDTNKCTGKEVKEKFDSFLKSTSTLFGATVDDNAYYIIEGNDILKNNDDAFSKLYSMTAYLDCVLKDENSNYWIINISNSEKQIPYFKISIDLKEEDYDSERVAYVDLSDYYDNANKVYSDKELESMYAQDGDGAGQVD